ncbi:MAG: archease [Candidatus Halalkalibacterium sp. M3_1C_030]
MGTYQEIDHPADKGFKVEAKSLQDLFETSVRGLAHMCREDLADSAETASESFIIDVEAEDITGLLVDFLSEILTMSHIQKMVFLKAEIDLLEETKVRAEIYGKKVDYFDEDIKAVTYHQADIRKNGDGNYETTVVFDI